MLPQLKRLLPFLILLMAPALHAQTINAASCSQHDVVVALGSVAADGTTVMIPSCAATVWGATTAFTSGSASVSAAGTVTYNQVFSTVIQGQTTITGTCAPPSGTCTAVDNTIIEDGVNHGGSDPPMLALVTATGKSIRLTGLSIFQYSGNTTVPFTGIVALSGSSHLVRIDHIDWLNLNSGSKDINFLGSMFGVIDHNYFNSSPITIVTNDIEFQDPFWNGNTDSTGLGNASWNDVDFFGTGNFMFAENNVIVGGWLNDCTAGGRFVARYNYLGPGAKMQTHGLTSDIHRSCRAMEVYNNSMVFSSNPTTTNFAFMIELEGGTGLFWGNTITGFIQFIHEDTVRTNNLTYSQVAPPSGWGYCGTAQSGVSSAYDQNTDSTGHKCIDQVGVGKGDLMTGTAFPVLDSVTGTVTFPNQVQDPVYAWNNTYNPVPQESNDHYWSNSDTVAVSNRDYYLELPNFDNSATFNGTGGVGMGPLASRTTTCTPNANGAATGVGWWETDNLQLDFCIATNTWSTLTSSPPSYKPYTYPHPLDTSTSAVTFSPTSLVFGTVPQGTTSSGMVATISNTTGSTITMTSLPLSGTNAGDFTLSANTCGGFSGSTLTNGSSCTATYTFKPTATPGTNESATATLNFTGGGTSPITLALSGTSGANAAVTFTPAGTLVFGNQVPNTTSASENITVTSSGTGNLILAGANAVTLTGTNAAQFAVASTTCTNGLTLTPTSTCTITVTFTPNAAGLFVAQINLADNAPGSPQVELLAGTGATTAPGTVTFATLGTSKGASVCQPQTGVTILCLAGDGLFICKDGAPCKMLISSLLFNPGTLPTAITQ
jgi:hypothetical protein